MKTCKNAIDVVACIIAIDTQISCTVTAETATCRIDHRNFQKLGSAYELCYIIISIFNFLIFKHFSNQITLKPSLAQKLELLFKFSTIIEQINVPLWTNMVPLCLPLVMFYYSWCKPSVLFAMIDKFTKHFSLVRVGINTTGFWNA